MKFVGTFQGYAERIERRKNKFHFTYDDKGKYYKESKMYRINKKSRNFFVGGRGVGCHS